MDPVVRQAIVIGVVELLMCPLIVAIFKLLIGRRLDDFDQKRERARQETEAVRGEREEWQHSMTMGMRSMLRAEIISEHDRWMRKGYCPVEARDNLARLFASYTQLHGNGVGKTLFEEIMDLPTGPHHDEI